jgi:hypothetical protein
MPRHARTWGALRHGGWNLATWGFPPDSAFPARHNTPKRGEHCRRYPFLGHRSGGGCVHPSVAGQHLGPRGWALSV